MNSLTLQKLYLKTIIKINKIIIVSFLESKCFKLVTIKSKKEIEIMKEACRIANETQKIVEKAIKPGISTLELDKIAEKYILSQNAIPAQKNYPNYYKDMPPFPGTLCISINDVLIHGIPSDKIIVKDGDIVSIDLVVLKNGYHGDCARTYLVGNVSKEAKELVEVTKQAFFEGIKFAKKGNRLGDISSAIGNYVKEHGYSVVKEFQGHGIGKEMHEDPGIPNYGKAGKGIRLMPGMTLAIEPMVIMGKEGVFELDDGWTIVSEDGTLTAHYENTVLITENEPQILTL